MKKQIGLMTVGLMLATPALAGGAGAPVRAPAAGSCKSIAQIVASDAQFSTLATAIEAAGLKNTMSGAGSYTVFAPTNAAFAKVPSDKLAGLLNDPEALRGLVLYHVVSEKATMAQIRGVQGGTTMQGGDIAVSVKNNKLMINNATVIKGDIMACNGIVHVIDTVLMPEAQAAAPAPAPAPVAAPAPAPAPVATQMVIPALPASGSTISTGTSSTGSASATTTQQTTVSTTTNTSTATSTTTTTTTDTSAAASTSATETTIYDAVINDDRFSTFRDLLSDADMTDVLTSGEYTVFAPTNDAFDALPDGVLAAISSNPEALKQVLNYHLVAHKVTTEQINSGAPIQTVEGSELNLGTATVGTAINSSNGFIYPIDVVLLPDDFKVPDVQAIAADTSTTPPNITTYLLSQDRFSVLRGLLSTAGLANTLTSGNFTLFAPTNDAFAKLSKEDLDALSKDANKLKAVLTYHVIAGHPDAAALTAAPLKTLEGSDLTLAQTAGGLKVGDNAMVSGDVVTTGNGNVYAIDTILMPPSLK